MRAADDEEDEPEGEEPPDGADVTHGSGEHLARLPLVVEAHMEPLQVLVEGVSQVPLQPGGASRHDEPSGHGQPAVDHTEG